VAHDRNRRHVGERKVIEAAQGGAAESAARRLSQIVVFSGLIVDGRDPAIGVGSERILRGRVGVSTCIGARQRNGLYDADIQRLAV
jgi:hypothetical protein